MNHARIVLTAAAATSLCAAAADAQTLEGSYRGTFVCEKIKVTPDILYVPLDRTVRGDAVQFARPRFNLTGTRVIGSELAFGMLNRTASCT
jgi:nitrous oxidase accessory protein NosD